MPRSRILVLIDSAIDSGGAERFSVGLATHLPSERYQVWLCATRDLDPRVARTLEDAGVAHVHLGRRSRWDIHRFAKLAALLKHERIEILHAHMFGSNVWGTLLGRLCSVPVVLAHEHTWSYEGQLMRRLVDGYVIGRLARRFIAVSQLDASRMVSVERVPPEKVVVMPTAYIPRPPATGGDLRAELGIGDSTPLIGSVSVLRPQKALDVLVKAFAQVVEAVPDAHLAIVGLGPCLEPLRQLARELELEERVHFLGHRRDVDVILRSVDVAAMSSDFEGTPLVAFECFANRTVLVATAVGGLPDIISNGRTGVLVPPQQPGRLAAALVELLDDRQRAAEMTEAAAATLEQYLIGPVAQKFADLYELLLSEARAEAVSEHG